MGGEAFDDEKESGNAAMGEKEYVVMIIAGILLCLFSQAGCLRRENKKNRRTEEKKTTVLRYLLFRQNFYAVICDKYHVFDLG